MSTSFTRAHFVEYLSIADNLTGAEGAERWQTARPVIYMLALSKAAWASDAILDLLHGRHGEQHAIAAAKALVGGMREPSEPLGTDLKRFVTYNATNGIPTRSFASLCLARGRHDALGKVALGGMPPVILQLPRNPRDAVHEPLRWLDVLSSTNVAKGSYPKLLLDRRVTEPLAIQVLLEQDPNHPDIPLLHGTETGAILNSLSMAKAIKSGSPPDRTASSRASRLI